MGIFPILISAAVCFVIGFLFHGPLFGKVWMRLAKITPTGNEKLSEMKAQMFWNYFSNVVQAFVLSGAIWISSYSAVIGEMTWYKGMIIGLCLWLGNVLTTTSIDVIWMGKSWKLWLFDNVSFAICSAVMGIILAIWR